MQELSAKIIRWRSISTFPFMSLIKVTLAPLGRSYLSVSFQNLGTAKIGLTPTYFGGKVITFEWCQDFGSLHSGNSSLTTVLQSFIWMKLKLQGTLFPKTLNFLTALHGHLPRSGRGWSLALPNLPVFTRQIWLASIKQLHNYSMLPLDCR